MKFGKNKEHTIIGFIDRLVYNLTRCEYEIHDYKTANNLPPKEKINGDRQLALYAIAIKELFGQDKEVSLVWHYLTHNTRIKLKKTNQELEDLKYEIIELIRKIESTKEFTPTKSVLCSWCEYKNICPIHNPEKNQNNLEKQEKITDKYPFLKKYI